MTKLNGIKDEMTYGDGTGGFNRLFYKGKEIKPLKKVTTQILIERKKSPKGKILLDMRFRVNKEWAKKLSTHKKITGKFSI